MMGLVGLLKRKTLCCEKEAAKMTVFEDCIEFDKHNCPFFLEKRCSCRFVFDEKDCHFFILEFCESSSNMIQPRFDVVAESSEVGRK
jgi:uncharacterized cysteine cluster protein YcgN (CxxCxxCC family)